MTEISDMSVVSVLSVKGGTGKTTTTLVLASLLTPEVPVTIIEGQRVNPQYRSLLFPENVEPEIIQVPYSRNEKDIIPITYVRNSPVFQNQTDADNLSLILLDPPRNIRSVEGRRSPVLQFGIWRTHRILSDSEINIKNRVEKVLAIHRHFDNERDVVIIDYDAGLDRRSSMESLPFHRAVHEYGVYHSMLEQGYLRGMNEAVVRKIYEVLTKQKDHELDIDETVFLHSYASPSPTGMYNITDPYPMGFEYGKLRNLSWFEEEEYPEKDRFKRGLMIFVASPAVAEIRNLVKRKFFFRDLGPNNHYVLVINQARDEDVEEIDKFLRSEMGDAYMFERVFGLPHVPYMNFGNMRTGGNPYELPTYSDSSECREYTEKLGYLADYILSHV